MRNKMTIFTRILRSGGWLPAAALFVALPLPAGQSLVLPPTVYIPLADPQLPPNQSWRVEFQIHNWALPASGAAPIIGLSGVGFEAFLQSDGQMLLESLGDTVVQQAPCYLNLNGLTNALVRFQRNVPTKTLTCEVWNYDSTGYNTQTDNINIPGNLAYGGGGLGGGGVVASVGFLRVFTTLLPLGGRPPVTADHGDWTELKFDGTLTDSSGHGHSGTGAATYTPTPNQVPVALPKTSGAPFWSNWVSLRAGFPAELDGSASYTLADGSAAVTYLWQQSAGPSTLVWRNRNAAVSTVSGLIFGTYTFELQVTDAAGNNGLSTIVVGAVATDSNGVVVQANPAADAIYGPMIAFGKNPWSWADERNLRMENLQKNTYATPPAWATPAESATVNYTFFDPYGTPPAAATSGAVTSAALTITLASTGTLDLASMPTEVLVGNYGSWEIVRICSVTGTTLNVCYDGRGFHYGYDSYIQPASAWPSGTMVWQAKVKGNGTHFLSTICPNGPGWQQAATLPSTSAGTVAVTPGSTAVTGNGTAWTVKQTSLAISVSAKHGGVPFTFFSYVVSVNGGTSLTLARPFPSDADAGSYTFNIFSDQRRIVLHYTRTDSTDGYIYFPTAGCETDTDAYLYGGWDNVYAGQHNPTAVYSLMDGIGYTNDFSPNYYDIGLAHYAFYFRSGFKQALTSARNLEDYWLRYPENAQGDAGGNPRDRGVLGVVAAAVLDGDRTSNWSGLRTFAQAGLTVAQQNYCDADMRESGYQLSWLALAAQFDPDPVQRAKWQTGLTTSSYTRDSGCKRSDNSFATAFYWTPSVLQVAATQGSQTVTALGGTFPANMCYSTAHGTAMVTNGSALLSVVTGAFVPPAGASYKLMVGGTLGGVRYDLSTQFDYHSATSVTMSALWPGDSGTVYWSIEDNDNNGYVLTISQGPNDTANFGQITSCTLTDSTHIQLYRPWPTPGGTFNYFYYNLVGRGTQTFMAGIKTLQMRYAAQVYAPYQTLDAALANWVGTTGFDATGTKGIYYGRVFPQCEPAVTDSGIKDVADRVAACIENSYNPPFLAEARARNAEAQNAMTVMYLANPNATNRALGDTFYGATYGASGYTSSGYFTDGITSSNLDDGSLSGYKWPGFFFGVGMAHQWPAARIGGVAPPQYRTVYIGLDQTVGSSSQIAVTAPSGAKTVFPCGSTSPCAVTVDDRQGAHWLQVQYLSAAGKVLAQSDPDLLSVPPQS
jgi:K319L-like, PKD domain